MNYTRVELLEKQLIVKMLIALEDTELLEYVYNNIPAEKIQDKKVRCIYTSILFFLKRNNHFTLEEVISHKDCINNNVNNTYITNLLSAYIPHSDIYQLVMPLLNTYGKCFIIESLNNLIEDINTGDKDLIECSIELSNLSTKPILFSNKSNMVHVSKFSDDIDALLDNGSSPPKIVSTGYDSIDSKIWGGFYGGDIVIVAGRPSVGKTTFMLNLITNQVSYYKVGVISIEMRNIDLISKILSFKTGIPFNRIRSKSITENEASLVRRQFHSLCEYSLAFLDVEANAKSIYNTILSSDCDVFYIDYIQLVAYCEKHSSNNSTVDIINEICGTLKKLAVKKNIPIVLMAQIGRESLKTPHCRPANHHLKDSGALEQTADTIMFVHNPAYEDHSVDQSMANAHDEREIIVSKQRLGGLGSCIMRFDGGAGGFIEKN